MLFQANAQDGTIWLHPNKGQWHPNIKYQVDLAGGKMYVESDGFTYHFYENPRKDHHDHSDGDEQHDENEFFKQHVVKSKFIGSNWNNETIEKNKSGYYRNYFNDNNPSNWQSELYSYGSVLLKNYYNNIDLHLDGSDGQLKYSFFVAPTVSTNQIQWKVDGANSIKIDGTGNLVIETTLGSITETKPIAWTIKNGVKTLVDVNYKLKNKIVSFQFPNGYNENDTLIIDPFLVFSTYTGSTSDNWGMTATPGANGELFAGGITFGAGYPTTTGAIDNTYNGGTQYFNIAGFDVTISKFSENGSQLLYSTYLGGNANELPESMIINAQGELFVVGITASRNFPLSGNSYQNTFGGGPTATHNSLSFVGSDLFIAKFNSDGTQLLASTYLGGSNLDGLNISNLSFNYGDQYRGEIILQGDDVLIASHSRSTNFPVTNGSTLQGTQDIVAFKMNNDLSQLVWSSYFGGQGDETGNSLAISTTGELYIAGGTSSADFSLIGNDVTYGGDRDGYILKLNSNDGSVISGTYLGDNEYDQCYFVKTDIDDYVYVFGQTHSNWTITPGKYGNPNSGQFIRKYTNDLLTIEWTTTIGAGGGVPEISPTAFLISDCYDIFISGWGGLVNVSGSQAIGSSSNGFPVTPDAYQAATNGSNFYLGILSQDANNLIYGTYMGGFSSSSNHVDGGTSRFDRSGAVYHAVCASCSGNLNGFVSTPGVWSTTNNSPNCNLAAFKFQLGMPYSLSANSAVCNGAPIQLNATGGTSYTWSPAASLNNPNIPNPIATPTVTTVYYVTMDFNEGCAITDSIIVEVISQPDVDLSTTNSICLNDTLSITASGGLTYSWTPNININRTDGPTVRVWPDESRYYYVTASNECFDRIDSIYVTVHPLPEIMLIDDTLICLGSTALLSPTNTVSSINWEVNPTLQSVGNGSANVTPTQPTYYFVNGIDGNGCENRDSVLITFFDIPDIIVSPDTSICLGSSTPLSVSGGLSYSWSPTSSLTGANTPNPIATPLTPTRYTVQATYGLGCLTDESIFIDLLYLPTPIVPDTVFACFEEPREITVGGADAYSWSPSTFLSNTVGPTVNTVVNQNIIYTVSFTNVCGTVYDDIPVIAIFPYVEAFGDTTICPDQSTILSANGALTYVWTPSTGLNKTNDSVVISTPSTPTEYIVTGTDKYGCIMRDTVFVGLYPRPFVHAGTDQYILKGDEAQITAISSSPNVLTWSPSESVNCISCLTTLATPHTDTKYTITLVDENGCVASDFLWIYLNTLLYIPNTFTPDGDEFNNVFKAIGGNITEFEMNIFNRWGELVFTTYDINVGWDGTYNGKMSQDGTYTWTVKYKDLRDQKHELNGHINLLR